MLSSALVSPDALYGGCPKHHPLASQSWDDATLDHGLVVVRIRIRQSLSLSFDRVTGHSCLGPMA